MTNMARLFEQALLSVDRLEARRLVEVAAIGHDARSDVSRRRRRLVSGQKPGAQPHGAEKN